MYVIIYLGGEKKILDTLNSGRFLVEEKLMCQTKLTYSSHK